MKRKAVRRRDRLERELPKAVSGEAAKTAINRQGQKARAHMAGQGRQVRDVAATIAPWSGNAWKYGPPSSGDFRHVDHRYELGATPAVLEGTGGHVRPELRLALDDAVVTLRRLQAEWGPWNCKDQRHHFAPLSEFCTSRVLFGRSLVEVGALFIDITGWSMYLVQPDNLYGRDQLEKEVRRIHHRLCLLAERLSKDSVPRPVEMRPPRYERLRDGVLERLFGADLDARIDAGHSLLRGLGKGGNGLKEVSVWNDAVVAVLMRGLGEETVRGFRCQTMDGRVCKIPNVDRVVLGSAYLELGLVYLEEVRKRLPDYAEAAGQRPWAGGGVHNSVDGSIGSAVQAGSIYGDVHFHSGKPDSGRSG